MRAKYIYSDNGLNIFKHGDDSYSATRNSVLYTFMWVPYRVYNFKKVGTIGEKYINDGKIINNPHIQMIIQVQRKINETNQLINDININQII